MQTNRLIALTCDEVQVRLSVGRKRIKLDDENDTFSDEWKVSYWEIILENHGAFCKQFEQCRAAGIPAQYIPIYEVLMLSLCQATNCEEKVPTSTEMICMLPKLDPVYFRKIYRMLISECNADYVSTDCATVPTDCGTQHVAPVTLLADVEALGAVTTATMRDSPTEEHMLTVACFSEAAEDSTFADCLDPKTLEVFAARLTSYPGSLKDFAKSFHEFVCTCTLMLNNDSVQSLINAALLTMDGLIQANDSTDPALSLLVYTIVCNLGQAKNEQLDTTLFNKIFQLSRKCLMLITDNPSGSSYTGHANNDYFPNSPTTQLLENIMVVLDNVPDYIVEAYKQGKMSELGPLLDCKLLKQACCHKHTCAIMQKFA